VTEVRHSITKKGTGWGAFKLQDFEGDIEFALFGDDYINFSQWFVQSQVLYIKGDYRPKWSRENEYEIRIKEVRLLDTASQQLINEITITVDSTQLTERLITDLHALCDTHKGKHKLCFNLRTANGEQRVALSSKSLLVNVNDAFRNELKRLQVEFVLA
jgi:DNA polymerase-3 subunit alpha